jgi:hypothetical protein
MEKKKAKYEQPNMVTGLDTQSIKRKFSVAESSELAADNLPGKSEASVPLTPTVRKACKTFLLPDAKIGNDVEDDATSSESAHYSTPIARAAASASSHPKVSSESANYLSPNMQVERVTVRGVAGADPVAPADLTEMKLPDDSEAFAAQG